MPSLGSTYSYNTCRSAGSVLTFGSSCDVACASDSNGDGGSTTYTCGTNRTMSTTPSLQCYQRMFSVCPHLSPHLPPSVSLSRSPCSFLSFSLALLLFLSFCLCGRQQRKRREHNVHVRYQQDRECHPEPAVLPAYVSLYPSLPPSPAPSPLLFPK